MSKKPTKPKKNFECAGCGCDLPEGWMIPYSRRGSKYYCSKCG